MGMKLENSWQPCLARSKHSRNDSDSSLLLLSPHFTKSKTPSVVNHIAILEILKCERGKKDFLEMWHYSRFPCWSWVTVLLLFPPCAPCVLPRDRVLTRSPGVRLRQIFVVDATLPEETQPFSSRGLTYFTAVSKRSRNLEQLCLWGPHPSDEHSPPRLRQDDSAQITP